MKIFFVQLFCVFLPPLLNIFCFCQVHTISVLYWAHLCMKCLLGSSNFLEEIFSLSHSIVFLYFFALITEEVFLISPCYSLEFCILMGIYFLFSFAFHFSSFDSYFLRPLLTAILFFCFSFSWGWSDLVLSFWKWRNIHIPCLLSPKFNFLWWQKSSCVASLSNQYPRIWRFHWI